MSEPRDIAQVIGMLSAAFPNFKPSEMTPEVYYQTLQDIPADELKAAVLHCVSEAGRAFAPSIGEIRGAVLDLRKIAANVPTSYQAWQEVQKAFIECGMNNPPEWTHPLIAQTVKTFGWRNLCMSENATADRMRFIQAYEQLAERAEKNETMLPQVRGYIETRREQLSAGSEVKKLAEGMRK